MGWIYKITNKVNGKAYIGKTELQNPYDRWKEHKHDYQRRKIEKRPLYSAMNKYGVDNFEFNVIGEYNDGQELCSKEREYIEKYRTYVGFGDCNGYNATLGGDGKSYIQLDEEEVIKTHMENGYISGVTAKIYHVDPWTIRKILQKHNIKWLSYQEITALKFKARYGGLVQIDNKNKCIVNIYTCPYEAVEKNPRFKHSTLKDAYSMGRENHNAYGFLWYRLSDLPDIYKDLLDKYYADLQ